MAKKELNSEKDINKNTKNMNDKKEKNDKNKSEIKNKADKNKKDNKNKSKTKKSSKAKNKAEDKIKELEEKINELNDRYLRLVAEYDNYRKRTLKEKTELIKTAGEDTLINFLPVMDNIDRAKKSVDEAKDIEAVKEGINLIYKHLYNFLKERGIKEIKAVGEVFDTDLHEALTKVPAAEDDMKGKVVDVIEKGYKMNDKVLRYAKVVVGE